MNTKLVAAAVLAAALTLTSGASAGPVAAKQRVAITARASVGVFVLSPLKGGAVARDSGTAAWGTYSERTATRDGQAVEINDPLVTLYGKGGSLVIRFRIEWVDAGNGYSAGTGTWRVVRGTGAYAGFTGGGRSAHAWLPTGPVSWRAEGFIIPKKTRRAKCNVGSWRSQSRQRLVLAHSPGPTRQHMRDRPAMPGPRRARVGPRRTSWRWSSTREVRRPCTPVPSTTAFRRAPMGRAVGDP